MGLTLLLPLADDHGNLDGLAETLQHGHKAVDGEAAEFRPTDAREIGMVDARQRLRLARCEGEVIEGLRHLAGQNRLELSRVGIGTAKVAVEVAAAMDQDHVIVAGGHLSCSFGRLGRSLTGSISCLGVAIPRFEFFWNAWITQTASASFST